jgi:ribonucleoside-diphosphate reductase alpha subunit
MEFNMYVTKRNGETQEVAFDKINKRVKQLCIDFNIHGINHTNLVIKVIDQLYNNISTTKIDELTAEQCAYSSSNHPEYGVLAGAIVISNCHKNTDNNLLTVVTKLYEQTTIITENYYRMVLEHSEEYESMIDYSRDYLIDYFGFKTLEKTYLLKINDTIVERVQHLWMRVAIQLHGTNMELVKETYDNLSTKQFIHATPTLFNSGCRYPQLSSCYLVAMEDDSLEGIFNTLRDCANISKWAGGIGLHIHNIRANGSKISSTGGNTNGLVPMLKVFNDTAKYINQGGKRNGSYAIYLEPWHADVESFLEMKKTHGDEESKARDLFYALWVPNLFMDRVKTDKQWSLFCPKDAPGLSDVYGEEFNSLYESYEQSGIARKVISARSLWLKILTSQMETGTPYLLYKDACNQKSNQKNLGTIKSSNLCTEIIEYSDANETAVCNLGSLVLPACVENGLFNYDKLHRTTKILTRNLNKVIDINFYPTEKTRLSNMRHRPIGLGVQGLADTFFMLNIPYHSEEAIEINKLIFETIYHAAVEQSYELALECGHYETFVGSPASNGILQFDMWNVTPSSRYDWEDLKTKIKTHGMRNSLLVAPMPTATTSQILGYTECFEPITSNIYTRRTLAGEFILTNKYLMKELIDLGLWNTSMKNAIITNKGSIQNITTIPSNIRDKYKIVWEIPMKHLIDMAADRGAYICQSQSLNLWMEEPNFNKLTSMHMYSYSKGLKTGIYYLRRKARHTPQQFTIEPEKKTDTQHKEDEKDEICESCSA